ncbi:NAD(P)-dependent oxidoreductase [Siphonobacter sp. BAB-5385]|uniref:SDR family NAD(P)-dependent oxidoreductase n=1 Tax=Siphonobacter sp. BAB-5385 TaxID=1864822 RepID=UPI000B9E94E9|nr:SDR family NAD(P)-dependent oxidoreductase [Siphonobacter sp. BAB-5385]OZI10034.1 NAD(P)-dependent oxidoreductase [Siphonobacter sp. BAB-5385]
MSRTAFITGATSGIGRATALAFAELGYRLLLHGRRQERLDELKEELQGRVDVHTLNFDVRYREDVEEAFASVPESWQEIDILVNNAGNAHGLGPIQENDPDDWDAMIDGNVKGILYVSKLVMPGMIARRSGHIINISSVAGKQTYPNGTVYCASKSAVESISQGMRMDLNPFGVKVTNIAPGAVETEFSLVRFKGDEKRADLVYQGFTPLSAEDIAETITFVVTRPPHVVLADILIFPTAQASAMLLKKD